MLEIIILVLCGRHIASIAKRKNRNPVGYVILMVFGWYGGAFGGAIFGAVLAAAAQSKEEMLFIIPLLLLGAVSGLGCAYLIVCSVSPLKRPRRGYDDEYDDYDDYDLPSRRRDHDYEDGDHDRPRSRRRYVDEDDDRRPRRSRRRDDD